MKNRIKPRLLMILLCVCLPMLLSSLSFAQDKQPKRVLVLHSYHRGLSWDDAIDRAIESILKKDEPKIIIQIEYMDTKRIHDAAYMKQLYEIYRHKFKNRKFDVIISVDNNALKFLVKHRDALFPGIPVVFCGVNNFHDSMLEGQSLYTGVVEAIEVKGTIDIALKLHPKTRQIIIYGTDTPTYLANKEVVKKMTLFYKGSVDIIFVEGLNIKEVQDHVRKLPNHSIVLLIASMKDEKGGRILFRRFAEMVDIVSHVPQYSLWDFILGYGIFGGRLISAAAQGEAAARMALRILHGEKVADIPVLKESPNRFMFDYNQMRRFGLSPSDLPQESILINMPSSFYSQYKGLVWAVIITISSLFLFIAALGITIALRRRAEVALQQSEKRFRDLFDSITDLIFTQDLEGGFLSVNPAMTKTFGYEQEEFIGRKAADFMKPEFRPLFESEYLGQLKTRGYYEGITTYFSKDARKIYIEYHSTLVKPEEGESYISGTGRDVTERVLAERQIMKLQDLMLQAKKMEAIGVLAGGIAHDFNNLLMGIQGNASLMLLDSNSRHPHHEKLKSIEQYVQQGADLTKQLLGFARGGKYEVMPTDLNELITHQNRLFGRTKKEIRIDGKYEKDLWTVEVDQGQLEQVLLNLYINAWQAMPGGGDLYVQTENVELDEGYVKPLDLTAGRYVKISITDTGIGMDDATRQRIFDPFFTTKEMGRGTGLGLASVYGIIKNHGGMITVYSEKGEGTTFNIYLPVIEAEGTAQWAEREGEVETLRGEETVLLVDDEEMIIEVGEEILHALGYKVLIARGGKEAIGIYRENSNRIDIVLLDMIMPDMGGGATYDRLKEINPHIKVLLSSGYSIDGQAQEILDRGCNGFIQKPFNIKDLSQKLREILDKGGMGTNAIRTEPR